MARTSYVVGHTKSFTDHAGQPAQMVWWGHPNVSLPQLLVAVFYFVHPDFDGNSIDPVVFNKAVFGASNELVLQVRLELTLFGVTNILISQVRLELFFVPGATAQDCVDHFHAELAARGHISQQIEEVHRVNQGGQARTEPSHDNGQTLPGLISPNQRQTFTIHQSGLLMFEGPSWAISDEAAEVRLVMFDPITPEEYDVFKEPRDPDWSPLLTHDTLRIHPNIEIGNGMGVCDWIHECKYTSDWLKALGTTQYAEKLGWQSW